MLNHGVDIYICPQVDVYSFGVVMWELWERRRPFEDLRSRFDIADTVAAGGRPPIGRGCPPPYADLVRRCWHQVGVISFRTFPDSCYFQRVHSGLTMYASSDKTKIGGRRTTCSFFPFLSCPPWITLPSCQPGRICLLHGMARAPVWYWFCHVPMPDIASPANSLTDDDGCTTTHIYTCFFRSALVPVPSVVSLS